VVVPAIRIMPSPRPVPPRSKFVATTRFADPLPKNRRYHRRRERQNQLGGYRVYVRHEHDDGRFKLLACATTRLMRVGPSVVPRRNASFMLYER
jgi:hypothetical protein